MAVALTYLRDPETIVSRPSLNQLLDQLDIVQTQRSVRELVSDQPRLLNRIDRLVNQMVLTSSSTAVRSKHRKQILLDTQPYRSGA